MKSILAIDLGSTVFKAALFDPAMNILAAEEHPVPYTSAACTEIDWHLAMEASLALAGGLAAGEGMIPAAVAVTSQAQTFALRVPGRDPEYFKSWRSVPSGAVLQEARGYFGDDFALDCAFCEPVPGIALCTLREMRDAGMIPPEASLEFLPGALAALLTGRNCIDINSAAMTGLFSRRGKKWDRRALEWCGMSAVKMPELTLPGSICGVTSGGKNLVLPEGIPVMLCGNDQSAGAYSADIAENEVFISLGTAYSVYARIPYPVRVPGGASGEYLTSGAYALKTAPAGGDMLHKLVMERTGGDYKKFFAENPSSDPGFNALLQGIAETVRTVDKDVKQAVAAGGGARSPEMLDALSRILGIPVRRAEASPLAGAAAMALKTLDIKKGTDS